jgi:hypothetical protein
MQLRVGDRLTDEAGEYEVVGPPFTTAGGKTANVRVKRVDSDVQMIRTYGEHERVSVKRGAPRRTSDNATAPGVRDSHSLPAHLGHDGPRGVRVGPTALTCANVLLLN